MESAWCAACSCSYGRWEKDRLTGIPREDTIKRKRKVEDRLIMGEKIILKGCFPQLGEACGAYVECYVPMQLEGIEDAKKWLKMIKQERYV